MEQKEPTVVDQEFSEQPEKTTVHKIINAVLIGFMVGIIFYSIINRSVGVLTLIPVFIAWKLFNRSERNKKA